MVHSPLLSLKIIVVAHFVLSVWGSMSPHLFLTPAYAYMNAFILLFGIWAITCPESVDAISMFLVLHLISIIMDIVFLGIFATLSSHVLGDWTGTYRFSLGMSITNLIIKPFTAFIMFRIYQDRGGQYNYSDLTFPHFGSPGPANRGYSDIDGTTATAPVETATPFSGRQ